MHTLTAVAPRASRARYTSLRLYHVRAGRFFWYLVRIDPDDTSSTFPTWACPLPLQANVSRQWLAHHVRRYRCIPRPSWASRSVSSYRNRHAGSFRADKVDEADSIVERVWSERARRKVPGPAPLPDTGDSCSGGRYLSIPYAEIFRQSPLPAAHHSAGYCLVPCAATVMRIVVTWIHALLTLCNYPPPPDPVA